MIRVVEFRGKQIEWVYGSLLQSEIDVNELSVRCAIATRFADHFSLEVFEVDPKSVGMWTGSYDKKGAKIFERDIVSLTEYGESFIGEVRFNDISWEVLLPEKSKYDGADDYITLRVGERGTIEVLGNIYDNPELIKRAK